MCFRVVFDKTLIGRIPSFSHLDREPYPEGEISAFSFPLLPVLSDPGGEAFSAGWGLIPRWVREAEKARKIRSSTVNARSETLHEKPSYRHCWPENRCVLPVRAFFEPHLGEEGKESWSVERRDGGIFFLGGLFEWTPPSLGGIFPERTFSLITLEARDLLAEIHNEKKRMPLVMTGEKALLWLEKGEGLSGLFDPLWQMDQDELIGKNTKREKKKSDFLNETSLFSIFN